MLNIYISIYLQKKKKTAKEKNFLTIFTQHQKFTHIRKQKHQHKPADSEKEQKKEKGALRPSCVSRSDEILFPLNHKDGCRLEDTSMGLC